MFDQFLRTGKERREAGGFIGFEGVRKHLKEGPPRRRIGLVVEGAPARRAYWASHSSLVTYSPNRGRTDSQSGNEREYWSRHLRHSVTHTVPKHCHGICEVRIPQEEHGTASRGQGKG